MASHRATKERPSIDDLLCDTSSKGSPLRQNKRNAPQSARVGSVYGAGAKRKEVVTATGRQKVPTALQQSIQRLSPIMANHLHTQHDDGPSPATSSGASINSVTAEHVPIEAQTYRGSASFQEDRLLLQQQLLQSEKRARSLALDKEALEAGKARLQAEVGSLMERLDAMSTDLATSQAALREMSERHSGVAVTSENLRGTLSTAIIGSAAQITSMRQQYEAQIQELQDKYDIKAHEATFLDDAVRELQQDLARVRQEAEDAACQSTLLMATAAENAHEREAALHVEVERLTCELQRLQAELEAMQEEMMQRGEALRKQHELIMELEALMAEANAHKEEAQNNELFLTNQLAAQGKEYESAIQELGETLSAKTQQCEEVTQSLHRATEQLHAMQTEARSLRAEATRHAARVAQLEAEVAARAAANTHLHEAQQQLAASQSACRQLTQRVSDLECEKDSLTSKLAQLQQVLSLGQAQVAALTVRVTAAEEERDALAGQLQRLRSSEVAAAASAEAGLRDAHGMLTARVAELQEALETARGVLASATANSQDSSGSPIAQLKGALAKAQGAHALSQAETNLALQQARLMRRALEDACMHRDRLEVKSTQLQQQLSKKGAALADARAQVERMEVLVQGLEQELRASHDMAEAQGSEAAQQLAAAQAQVSEAREAEATAVQHVAGLKQDADSLAQLLADKMRELSNLACERDELLKRVASYETAAAVLQRSGSGSSAADPVPPPSPSPKDLAVIASNPAAAAQLLERRHAQVECLRSQKEALETQLEEQEADMRLLREQVRVNGDLRARNAELAAQLKAAHAELSTANEVTEEVKAAAVQVEAQLVEAQAKAEEATAALAEATKPRGAGRRVLGAVGRVVLYAALAAGGAAASRTQPGQRVVENVEGMLIRQPQQVPEGDDQM